MAQPLWGRGAAIPRALIVSFRANVEVRVDVAGIIRWIVIGCYLLT